MLKWKSKNLDEMEASMEGAMSQEAGDYFQTIQTLQVPSNNENRNNFSNKKKKKIIERFF